MSSYQCCDCGEIKATKSGLEAHLNSDHLGWTPYQCFYCCQQGVSTRKHNKELLRDHMTQRHPDEEFTFLCTDDQNKKERLKDMLRCSTSSVQSPDVSTRETPVSVTASPDENASPFIISFSESPFPQPKDEVMDIEELGHFSPITAAIETSTDTAEQDIKPNLSVLGNCRCETCHESVPRNLVFIRDHVKLHFKEKTGCLPADLTNLLPNLQQIYCKLLVTSFPSVGASMLDDDIPNCNDTSKTTNQMETEDSGVTNSMDIVVENHDNHMAVSDSASGDNAYSNGHQCKECGAKFRRLASLKTHLTRYCKLDYMIDLNNIAAVDTSVPYQSSTTDETSTLVVSCCDVCGQKFLSSCSMHYHRSRKHGICVQWHCTECNLDFKTGGGFPAHLLQVHLVKRVYQCSLCETAVLPSAIMLHDKQFHGGLGKAQIVNNLHRYKDQVESLRRKYIIDKNSSNAGNSPQANPTLSPLKSLPKPIPKIIIKKTDSVLCCEICNQKVLSEGGMKTHKFSKHGVSVKWYCKECKINVGCGSRVTNHLRIVHLGIKKQYECDLCKSEIQPHSLPHHDKQFHGGLGKAYIVNNMNHYKAQVEALRKKLIIDLNSSVSSDRLVGNWKLGTPTKLPFANKTIPNLQRTTSNKLPARKQLSKASRNVAKFVGNKASTVLSCEICNETFSSMRGVKIHRATKHGICVKWYCKECNVQINTVTTHLLTKHLGKQMSVCSLCDVYTDSGKLAFHDRSRHNGLGNAQVVNNADRYWKELAALHNTLIVDVNAIVNTVNSGDTNSVSPQVNCNQEENAQFVSQNPIITQPKYKLQFKLERPAASDNLKWLSRFKRSQKRKLKQRDKLSFKRFGDIHSTMQP